MPHKKNVYFYAVIRIDEFQDDEVALSNKVKIVKIMENEKEAAIEVKRLLKLNSDKGCTYFHQSVRFIASSKTLRSKEQHSD